MSEPIQKSLLILLNDQGKIFIQDRKGYKKPDWGFFGGGIKADETPMEGLIREIKEELDLDLTEDSITFFLESDTVIDDIPYKRFFYLYKTNQETFTVLEGQGGRWVTFEEARELFEKFDKLDKVEEALKHKDLI